MLNANSTVVIHGEVLVYHFLFALLTTQHHQTNTCTTSSSQSAPLFGPWLWLSNTMAVVAETETETEIFI